MEVSLILKASILSLYVIPVERRECKIPLPNDSFVKTEISTNWVFNLLFFPNLHRYLAEANLGIFPRGGGVVTPPA